MTRVPIIDDMNYQLKLKRNNIPTNELLDDLKMAAKQIGRSSLTMGVYEKVGHFKRGVFKKRFGNWNKALDLLLNKET